MLCRATQENNSVDEEAGEGESLGKHLYCGTPGEEWVRQGEQAEQVWDWLVGIILAASRSCLELSGPCID